MTIATRSAMIVLLVIISLVAGFAVGAASNPGTQTIVMKQITTTQTTETFSQQPEDLVEYCFASP
jgi:phosphatidylserine/phosphatidylglycerophosphate/cardiolipin synthase-like enzyme